MELINNYDLNDYHAVQKLVEENILDRNKHIANIMRIFNLMKSSITLGIDGEWGTGKTVFVKELIHVANNEQSTYADVPSLSKIEIETFRKKFNIYYFNAWESDIYDNPLEVFLLNILQFQKEKANIAQKTIKTILEKAQILGKPFLNVATKVLTGGILEKEDFKHGETEQEILLEQTIAIQEKQKYVKEILELLTLEKEMIVVVDELDRCKPTFAVELLETLKHYFETERLNFIISFNKEQLGHTIKAYYGSEFNSIGYLDKFIDIDYSLPKPNLIAYATKISRMAYTPNDIQFKKMIQLLLIEHFDLSLRDTNKYYLFCELLPKPSEEIRSLDVYFEQILFPRFALILKIKDNSKFQNFITGNGYPNIEEFVLAKSKNFSTISIEMGLEHMVLPNNEVSYTQELNKAYSNIKHKKNTLFLDKLQDMISFIQ